MDYTNFRKQFNENTQDVEVSLIRQFDQDVQNIEGIILLTLGQPDFPTPEHVKKAGIKAIEQNFTNYTHSNGDLRVREAASSFLKEKYGLTYDPSTEVITTVGATEALTTALFTVLNPGDKVLIPSPFFTVYESIVTLAKGESIYLDTSGNDFILSPEMIEEAMEKHGDDVKAIMLNYPTNPTGVTWTSEECRSIAETIQKYPNLFVISDEIYSEFIYEGHHISIGEYLREQSIIINGISKSHSMTGWRIGFTFAPKDITQQMSKVHPYLVTSSSSVSQYAAIEALTEGKNDAIPMKDAYKERRDFMVDKLTELGFEIARPNGAFYIFAKIPEEHIQDSYEFSLNLAREAKVAVIPGIAFGQAGEGYIRISYVSSLENLKTATERISKFVK